MEIRFINRALLLLLLFGGCLVPSAPAQPVGPTLRITSSNDVNTIFWPLTAYEDILQTTTDLSPAATWTNLATGDQIVSMFPEPDGFASYITNVVGDEMAFSFSATNEQQFFRLSTPLFIPACWFAIFYNGLLEFSQCPPLVINGRVHANGPIYVGTSASSLIFNAPVTTTSNITAPYVDGLSSGWTPSDPNAWNTTFNGNPSSIMNVPMLGIPGLNPTNFHFLIDIPPVSEDPLSAIGSQRLYNEAGMILLVTNDINGGTNPMVTMILQSSAPPSYLPGADSAKVVLIYTNASPTNLNAKLPFLNLTNRFFDQREQKTNFVTQIDVGRFSTWVSTNQVVQSKMPVVGPIIFYVADRRNVNTNQMTVVRLVNAAKIPANSGLGFSVATINPLYTWGDYNIQLASGGATSQQTNNPNNKYPSALLSDSLTILSAIWTDAQSYAAYSPGLSSMDASDTTINAAIITGTMPSTGTSGTTFSGGVHNLPRLLEDWSSKNLWLNTSIIRLWDSQTATNQFRNPAGFSPVPLNPYYNPPARHFNFDQNFLNPSKIPPGIPALEVIP